MNKCLVTDLKAATGNTSLIKYNVLTAKISVMSNPTETTQWISIGTNSKGGVSINSETVGIYRDSGITGDLSSYPITLDANSYFSKHFENKEGVIEIYGKYNINQLSFGNGATLCTDELYGLRDLTRIYIINLDNTNVDASKLVNTFDKGNITQIAIPNINTINKVSHSIAKEFMSLKSWGDNTNLLFDGLRLSDLSDNTLIISIGTRGMVQSELSSLSKLVNLTTISFGSSVTGDIMDFINPWIKAGRSSGKLNVKYFPFNITLNGAFVVLPEGVSITNFYINWTSDGNVTFTAS